MKYRKHEEETRRRLRDALASTLVDKDINKVTVIEVNKYAGVTKPTFYKYYSDVYELLDDIVREKNNEFYSEYPEFPPLTDGNIKRIINYLRRKPEIKKILNFEHTRDACYGAMIPIIEENLVKYIGSEYLTSPNADYIKIGVINMIAVTVLHYIKYSDDEILNIEKYVDMFIDINKGELIK